MEEDDFISGVSHCSHPRGGCMTVKDLIEKLQICNKEAEVSIIIDGDSMKKASASSLGRWRNIRRALRFGRLQACVFSCFIEWKVNRK